MILTDTHTHLYLKEFTADIDTVVSNALDKGVKYFMLPNIDSSTVDDMNALCKAYPDNMFPMIGLHPTSVSDRYHKELQMVLRELETNKYYAVGEVGIDLYWDKSYEKEQNFCFRYQIELAREFKLPLVIHTRSSFDSALDIIEETYTDGLTGVFHCFGGTWEEAMRIRDLGFKFGIGGVVTFKNSGLDKVVDHLELEEMLLETDAPYLTPVPHRGQRNESAYISIIAEKIAHLKGVSVEEVARITTQNAKDLFKF